MCIYMTKFNETENLSLQRNYCFAMPMDSSQIIKC